MAITTFVASQILTAAQMNAVQGNDYNQTVSTKTASYTLVAADKGTRIVMNVASANTVTVNTSLFSAGDTLVIQNIGAGVSTVTAGTATVSSAGPLAIPQNGSGLLYFTSAGVSIFYPSAVTTTASALTLITAQTIGTTVSSVTVSSVFSSTYDDYLIRLSPTVGSEPLTLLVTYGSTVTGYYSASNILTFANTDASSATANGSSTGVGRLTATGCAVAFEVSAPNLASNTITRSIFVSPETGGRSGTIAGFLDNTTQYTAFTLTTTVGTITGGTIRVYGYAKS